MKGFLTSWPLLLGFGLLISCGKENTLNINEKWAISPPLGQIQDAALQITLHRDFTKSAGGDSTLTISVQNTSSNEFADLSFTIGGSTYGIGISNVNFLDIDGKEILIASKNHPIALSKPLSIPHGFFSSIPPSGNNKICIKSPISAASINWNISDKRSIALTMTSGAQSYSNDMIDYGFWIPGFDALQSLLPNLKPTDDTKNFPPKPIDLALSRSFTSDMTARFGTINEKNLTIQVTTTESFSSSLNFSCAD
jgi:hypothetical protein